MDHSKLFRRIGPLIWGDRGWQTAMAADLSLNPRSIRRWISGAAMPPAGVWHLLLQVVQQRQRELADAAADIETLTTEAEQ